MVKEFVIINSHKMISKPNYYCFVDPFEIKEKVNKVLKEENCRWTELGKDENIRLQAFYESEIAHLRIEILKTEKNKHYLFQLIALGGDNPMFEIAKLCKIYSWNAVDMKTAEYLDLDNTPKIKISDKDKEDYYDDYWERFNTIQEEEELKNIEIENLNGIPKKWWEFWK